MLFASLGVFAQQQGKPWRVGVLLSRHVDFSDSDYIYGPLRRGLSELGYVEGKNLLIEWRSAEGQYDRLPGLAAELVAPKVDVIVAGGSPATRAAQKATTTIPIIMGNIGDPIGSGFIKSLAHPGGNITGLSSMGGDVSPKQLELLIEIVPKLSHVAVMFNPSNTSNVKSLEMIQAAAQKRGIRILRADVKNAQEISNMFPRLRQQNAGALMILSEALFTQQKGLLADQISKHRLPAAAPDRIFSDAGFLMSYGPSFAAQYRRAAAYVDKLLKGARPADLPVEQPTVFELAINARTAKALGLKIPQTLLISANKVIE